MRKTSGYIIIQLILSLAAAICCQAQSSIRELITNRYGQPLRGVSVLLLKAKDSALVKGSVTANEGLYVFVQIPAGDYLISASYVGYKDVQSQAFNIEGKETFLIPTLLISEKEIQLEGITVSAKKPMFEQKIDRIVINVASSVTNAGSTALEVLMRSPGITVNQQNNTISMNGKEGVAVMLNGKLSRMPIDALVQMLAGMSSSNIEKIELITTPPASMDAEGSGGFINIV